MNTPESRTGPLLRRFRRAALVLLAAGVVVEAGVRVSGVVDFPVYEVHPEVGYLYRPSQRGSFLNSRAWAVNERSMPTAHAWQPAEMPNILVIGNSVVAGGNPFDLQERIAAVMERLLTGRARVWPIAVGGWSTVNEISYLESFPDVARAADFFVWLHVPGGLEARARWLGDDVFPRRKPIWATAYAFRRYVAPRLGLDPVHLRLGEPIFDESSSLSGTGDYCENLERFDRALSNLAAATGRRVPGVLLLYPTLEQLDTARRGQEWVAERADLEASAARHGIRIVDLTREPVWNRLDYRDTIHPTNDGNMALARILVGAIETSQAE